VTLRGLVVNPRGFAVKLQASPSFELDQCRMGLREEADNDACGVGESTGVDYVKVEVKRLLGSNFDKPTYVCSCKCVKIRT
jgi:hypothetical protein